VAQCRGRKAAGAEEAALRTAPADGFDRFLADLGGPRKVASAIPPFEEPLVPEMVSLEDLLAEEEGRGHGERSDDDWDNGYWNLDSDGGDRFN